MSKFIISIGLINKNIYLPIIYMIVYLGANFFWIYQNNNEVTRYLEGFGAPLGQIYIYTIGSLFKYRRTKNKVINKIEKSNKKHFKDFSILFVIDLLNFLADIYHSYFSDIGKDSFKELYLKDSIEIIFITLATFFILKYKYYIHHFISIAVFVILSIVIDVILHNYQTINKATIIISIIYVIVESFYYTYLKYLVEKKYYFTFDIIGILGSFDFIFTLISFIIEIIVNKVKRNYSMIFQFYFFYKEHHTWYMILRFLIGFIIEGIIISTLEIVILKELTPNYVIISYALSKIPIYIVGNEGNNRWIILAISIIQIISLLFYLEILEFNFCSLNKNTKKSIIKRERIESYTSQSIVELDNEIELKGYDIGEIMEKQELDELDRNEEDKNNMYYN